MWIRFLLSINSFSVRLFAHRTRCVAIVFIAPKKETEMERRRQEKNNSQVIKYRERSGEKKGLRPRIYYYDRMGAQSRRYSTARWNGRRTTGPENALHSYFRFCWNDVRRCGGVSVCGREDGDALVCDATLQQMWPRRSMHPPIFVYSVCLYIYITPMQMRASNGGGVARRRLWPTLLAMWVFLGSLARAKHCNKQTHTHANIRRACIARWLWRRAATCCERDHRWMHIGNWREDAPP